MRFLLEKSLATPEQIKQFDNMSTNKKLDFIDRFIETLPNYKYFESAKGVITQSILKDGFNTSNNKFLQYLTKVKWPLNDYISDVIYQLIENGNIKLNFNWLYNKSVYAGRPENVGYKIKALTYASNTGLQSNADKKIKPEYLFNGNKIKSIVEIKRILSNISTYTKAEDVDHLTGADIIRNKYKGEYKREQIVDYILNLYPKEAKPSIMTILANPESLSDIQKVLKADYTDKFLGDDIDSEDMFKNALLAKLNSLREKQSGKLQNLKKSDTNKRTGEEILIKDANIKNADELFDFAVKSVEDANVEPFKKKMFKTWLQTSQGKNNLNKILAKNYQDTLLGTALDSVKSDIADLIVKVE